MAVTTIGEVCSPYKTMQDWSFGFSGCIWSHLWPMSIVHCSAVCLMHPSAFTLSFKYSVVSFWLLLLGLMSLGARACIRRGCVLQGKHGPRCQDTAHTQDTQVYKIRQMKEFCYSNDLAQYLPSRQLKKLLWDMATELWLPLYLSSKGTFCSSEDSQWIPPLMLCSHPLPLNYHPFNPSGYENRSSAWPLPLQ